jgi:hypothetical protein
MAAPADISRVVADWVVTTIEEGITAEIFSAATVQRLNSVNIAREMLDPDEMRIFVTGIDIDPDALRELDLTEEHTLTVVSIGKRVKDPSVNAQSDPIIDQVGAIYRWWISHTDHDVEGVTRRLDKEKCELITLLDDALLHEKSIAVGGFVLAFVEDRQPEE